METELFDAVARPDRFATSEEIRAALCSFPDCFSESVPDRMWEVASDLGGHVLIDAEDEDLTLLERLDETAN
jgi:hypothetical protein